MSKTTYGISFSVKYALELGLDWRQAYLNIIQGLKFDRLRLMSYWDLVESTPGNYDFKDLDWQISQAKKQGMAVTLAVGMRQPRYPECHIPDWAKKLSTEKRNEALYSFLDKVVKRYKKEPAIESWQLENEALNKGIGECTDYDRGRLKQEYKLVKNLDPVRPIIMSTSDSFGLPLRRPRPDIIGFSIYLSQHRKGKYYYSKVPPLWFRGRKIIIQTLLRKPVIIHELQAEPWGPRSTADLSLDEQRKSMNPDTLKRAVTYARKTQIDHIDLWGAEWWYWQKMVHHNDACWQTIRELIGVW